MGFGPIRTPFGWYVEGGKKPTVAILGINLRNTLIGHETILCHLHRDLYMKNMRRLPMMHEYGPLLWYGPFIRSMHLID